MLRDGDAELGALPVVRGRRDMCLLRVAVIDTLTGVLVALYRDWGLVFDRGLDRGLVAR